MKKSNKIIGLETFNVKKTHDFVITGAGISMYWKKAEWVQIPQRSQNTVLQNTKIKILYSQTGLYFLFDCEDNKITASKNADFLDLWKEDVVEVFLWPDGETPAYFEYELSPLNYELAILISNEDGNIFRWQPFHYDEDRKTRHSTTIQGGEKKSGSSITKWIAEFFIPYNLLKPLKNSVPKSGVSWKANFYRMDYDNGTDYWAWQNITENFHEKENFGILLFE